ncbi:MULTISPECIES: penicillin acylase family protein [unclassified Streptomyces]|uniref:penicillin acylase family protein n=1 Tax=unclassified Streptomyces TaxID=2593676 RepID=UPI0037AA342A
MSARIHRDAHGIPHLWAPDLLELGRLQGVMTARDRAWQIEVERRRALGSSAAFLGPDHLAWDLLARRVRLEDTARRCFTDLSPETSAWMCAYTEGVNSALAQAADAAPEFAEAGISPGQWEPWAPLAIWLSHHLLFAGFPAKLWRDRVASALGPDALAHFATDGPVTAGSNGWLLSGERTVSGKPLLAGDPHRFIEAPGVYQQVRLACPEFDVVGFAVPGVPGIAHFGHTGGVAWAITNAMADYQDLYRERLRRVPAKDRPGVESWGPGGWEPTDVRAETVEVVGQEPVTVETVETARGPVVIGGPPCDDVLPDDLDPGATGRWSAVSLRWPARVLGTLGFDALPALLRARTVEDVDRAVDAWVEPVNVVMAADTAGGLLHRVAGAVPVRDDANRRGVVDAWDPAVAWSGGWEPLPRADVHGRAVMANERSLASPLGVEFAAPHRARRIAALLDSRPRWSAADLPVVHTDTLLPTASLLLDRLITPRTDLSSPAAALREELRLWDRHMDAGSRGAAVFAAWRGALARRLTNDAALSGLGVRPDDPGVFVPWLSPLTRIGHALEHLTAPGALPDVDVAVHARDALEEVAAAGAPATWGETHRLVVWEALPEEGADRPPVHGDHDCVMSSSSLPGSTDLSARASAARYVWDLSCRADSAWITPLGAAGHPASPHRHDQLPLWLRGELVPVATEWDALTEEP